jgi:pimeloyl-ACP methyl ester carboxylesterase
MSQKSSNSSLTKKTPNRLSRRALLIGGATAVALGGAALAVEGGVLPGRSTLHRLLGLNGPAGSVPMADTGPSSSGSFTSRWRAGSTAWTISYPPGFSVDSALPVLISLHGVGGDHSSSFGSYLGLDRFLAQSTVDGNQPFAIAALDGGRSYWHTRRSGEDTARMVIEEFIPLLGERGLLVDRVGLFGWSMGGFGALDLARSLGPDRVAVAIAESPALWTSADQTPDGAFDDREDFDAHTPFGQQGSLAGIPVRIDCGLGDGFYPAARDYVEGFEDRPEGSFEPGGHDVDYWRRMAPAQLAFAAEHLSG